MISKHRTKILAAIWVLFNITFSFGQDFSPQAAMGDSFSNYAYSGSFPFEMYLEARWERGSLSNCTANTSVGVNYNIPNGRLEISPLANTSGVNINGLKSKRKMNFQDGYTQVEVPTASSDVVTELSVGVDCDNWYRVYRKGSSLQFQSKTGGTATTISTIIYNPSLHGYWRIRHNPATNKIIYETAEIEINNAVDPTNPPNVMMKEKRLNWTQRAETTINFSLGEVRFEIVGGSDSSVSNPGLVTFDNFLFDSNSPEVIPPQQAVNTTYPTLDGTVLDVTNCEELQSKLNLAQPGDTVSIAPSLSCVGGFTLPAKINPNNKWIVVRSASTEFNSSGSLRTGRRINGENPAHSQQMPKILVNNFSDAGLYLPPGANYYRIVGIEVGINQSFLTATQHIGSLVYMEPSANQVNHVVIDRCYIHGELSLEKRVKRAIDLQGSHLAVIDSHISKVLHKGQQGQAIGAYSGTGPLKIENNFLEALAQNILIGGAGTETLSESITDVVIRRNYFVKRDELYQTYGCNPSLPDECSFPPVNGIELKQGRRVQISENVFNQTLGGIYIKNGGDNRCPRCLTEHINVENNKFINVKLWFGLTGAESAAEYLYFPQNPSHITVKNNLSYFTESSNSFVRGYITSEGAQGRDDVPDFRIIHTTQESYRNFFTTNNGQNLFNFELRDNIIERRRYGIGQSVDEGVITLNRALFPYKFRKNIMVNNSEGTDGETSDNNLKRNYPCYSLDAFCTEIGTYVVSSWDSAETTGDQVGFQETSWASRRSTGNYRLSSSSPYKNAGTDETDIGVNQTVLDAATAGAITGIWDATSQTPYPGPSAPTLSATIEVENFDRGGQGVAYNDILGSTGSGVYRSSPVEGVDIQSRSTASNGYAVFEAAAGEWLDYTVRVRNAGTYNISIAYASEFNGGKFRLEDCGSDPNNKNCVPITGLLTANSTGNWGTFVNTVNQSATLSTGIHIIRLVMVTNSPDGCGCIVANFDKIVFTYDKSGIETTNGTVILPL